MKVVEDFGVAASGLSSAKLVPAGATQSKPRTSSFEKPRLDAPLEAWKILDLLDIVFGSVVVDGKVARENVILVTFLMACLWRLL